MLYLKYIYIYLEPKWPLFWLEKALFWGDWPSKTEVVWVTGIYNLGCSPACWLVASESLESLEFSAFFTRETQPENPAERMRRTVNYRSRYRSLLESLQSSDINRRMTYHPFFSCGLVMFKVQVHTHTHTHPPISKQKSGEISPQELGCGKKKRRQQSRWKDHVPSDQGVLAPPGISESTINKAHRQGLQVIEKCHQ